MIASLSRNFTFIKTRKTGGTSAEIVPSSWCSGHDICSPISPEDELARAAFGGRAIDYLDVDRDHKFYDHMSAEAVRIVLPRLWDRAYKFTVERDPFEKVISCAYWNVDRRHGSLDDVPMEIERTIASKASLNYPLYSISGLVAVDEVIPYPRLWARLCELAEQRAAPTG